MTPTVTLPGCSMMQPTLISHNVVEKMGSWEGDEKKKEIGVFQAYMGRLTGTGQEDCKRIVVIDHL